MLLSIDARWRQVSPSPVALFAIDGSLCSSERITSVLPPEQAKKYRSAAAAATSAWSWLSSLTMATAYDVVARMITTTGTKRRNAILTRERIAVAIAAPDDDILCVIYNDI
mmetsp:Transcript_463/g.1012  ORF Transcript_463/g.1012 Transcript_463/m.1012 type:complete len:111 (-) Transcript_463:37-369(-)